MRLSLHYQPNSNANAIMAHAVLADITFDSNSYFSDAALCTVWSPLYAAVEAGLYGGRPWTPQQNSSIAQAILSSSHQAVPVSTALNSIGIGALEALVRADLLSYRPWSRERSHPLSNAVFACQLMIVQNIICSSPRKQGCTSVCMDALKSVM